MKDFAVTAKRERKFCAEAVITRGFAPRFVLPFPGFEK
jgi:hypothetical protein